MTNEERALELISELGTLMNPNPVLNEDIGQMILNQLNQLQKSIDELRTSKLVFSTKEVMEMLNLPSTERVDQLRRAGLLIGFKSGRGYQFTQDSINRFLKDIEGKDISNKEKVNITAALIKRNKKAAQGGTRAAG